MTQSSVSAQELSAFLQTPIAQAAKALAEELPPQLMFKKSPQQFEQEIKKNIQQQAELIGEGMHLLFEILRERGNCSRELDTMKEKLAARENDPVREDMKRVASGGQSQFLQGMTVSASLGLSEEFLDEAFLATKELLTRDPEAAYKVFCALILLAPNSYGFWLGMSTASHLCKRYQEAAELYRMTCAKFPWEADPYLLSADCYAASNQPEKEQEMLTLFIEYFSDQGDIPQEKLLYAKERLKR